MLHLLYISTAHVLHLALVYMLAQEEQVRERARQERDAREKLETRRLLDEAVAAKQKVMVIERLTPYLPRVSIFLY